MKPPQRTRTLAFQLTDSDIANLADMAKQDGTSPSRVVQRALRRYRKRLLKRRRIKHVAEAAMVDPAASSANAKKN